MDEWGLGESRLRHVEITDKLGDNFLEKEELSRQLHYNDMAQSLPSTKKLPAVAAPSRAWDALTPPLAQWIIDAVSDMGFKRMTPVQASTIPEFMKNRDVVVEAVTGSGKTLAYLIPVVERLLRLEEPLKKHHVGAIIISPTKELAAQIFGVLRKLLAFHGASTAAMKSLDHHENDEVEVDQDSSVEQYPASTLKVIPQLLVSGDITTAQDMSYFLKYSPSLLISTPGRLLELLSSSHVHCPQSAFEVLVLDEADRLLDLGFKDDLQKILCRLPKQRRTGLFSASISEAVDQLIRVGLRNSKKITVKVKGIEGGEDRRTPSSLQLSYIVSPASHKFPTVSKLLSSSEPLPSKSIIFLSTCAAVEYFQHVLPAILPSWDGQSFQLVPLHGKQVSKVRDKNFSRFSNSTTPTILLTTDVAARGLDIPQVDLVVQVDPPSDAKVFLHRCGRAGRAGRKGLSIVLLHPGREEQEYPGFLERRGTPVLKLTSPNITVTDEEATTVATAMRKTVLADRAVYDKAQRAFPSWVKSYSKHQASHIFRTNELDWEDLGKGWGLLKLPKMPELKRWEGDKSLGLGVDFRTYAYKDKQRETLRQQALKERDGNPEIKSGNSKEKRKAWSDKLDQQIVREKRRDKKRTRREREKWEHMTPAEKEEQKKLEDMIEQVKRRKIEEDQLGEFHGFDD